MVKMVRTFCFFKVIRSLKYLSRGTNFYSGPGLTSRSSIQYGEAKMTIFTTLVKFASTSFLQYMEANLTTFTYVIKIVIFASPYCTLETDTFKIMLLLSYLASLDNKPRT